jgi:hypothetical protein
MWSRLLVESLPAVLLGFVLALTVFAHEHGFGEYRAMDESLARGLLGPST